MTPPPSPLHSTPRPKPAPAALPTCSPQLQLLIDPLPIRHRLGAKEGGREAEETGKFLSLDEECLVGVGRVGGEVEVVLACEDEREGRDPAEEVGVVFLNARSISWIAHQRINMADSRQSRP